MPRRAATAADLALSVPAELASRVRELLGAVAVPDAVVAVVFGTGARHRLQVGDENLGNGITDIDVMDEVDVVSGADAAQEGDGSLIVGGAAIVVGSHVAEMQLLVDRRRSTDPRRRACVKVKKARVGGRGGRERRFRYI